MSVKSRAKQQQSIRVRPDNTRECEEFVFHAIRANMDILEEVYRQCGIIGLSYIFASKMNHFAQQAFFPLLGPEVKDMLEEYLKPEPEMVEGGDLPITRLIDSDIEHVKQWMEGPPAFLDVESIFIEETHD